MTAWTSHEHSVLRLLFLFSMAPNVATPVSRCKAVTCLHHGARRKQSSRNESCPYYKSNLMSMANSECMFPRRNASLGLSMPPVNASSEAQQLPNT